MTALARAFPRAAEGEGLWDAFLGSRPAYAWVRLRLEPAESLSFDAGRVAALTEPELLEGIRLGAVDTLIAPPSSVALLQTRITVVSLAVHRVESNPLAFRFAAREAVRQAIAGLESPRNPNRADPRLIDIFP